MTFTHQGKHNNSKSGRTGPIKCMHYFIAQIKLIKPCDSDNDWSGTLISMVPYKMHMNKADGYVSSLRLKLDPKINAYGVSPGINNGRHNLKEGTDRDSQEKAKRSDTI